MSSTGDFNDFTARLREFIRASECGVRNAECGIQLEPPHVGAYEIGFDSLALELFALHCKHNAPYRRFCESRGMMPGAAEHWSQIPAIPTSAFKELELSCLPAEERTAVFHSSGTTGQRPSRHFHNADSLAIYEASLLAWFAENFRSRLPLALRETQKSEVRSQKSEIPLALAEMEKTEGPLTPALSPSEGERENHRQSLREGTPMVSSKPSTDLCPWQERFVILTPPPAEAPQSSLVHMFETLRRQLGSADSVYLGHSDEDGSWTLDSAAALEALSRSSAATQPVLLLGTAFSYVHLLDDLARRGRRFDLAPGSRAMETGGYKGRSRSLEKIELHALITHHLGIPSANIICEFGMSELGSQAYDCLGAGSACIPAGDKIRGVIAGRNAVAPSHSRHSSPVTRHFQFPPWCRAQIISPETGRAVAEGETGLIRIFDLANVYSVMAIQTEDLGVRRREGFELLGRAALAEPRGCSLMAI